jgi:hypothetical protein
MCVSVVLVTRIKKPEPSDLIQAERETLNMSISKGVHFDNAQGITALVEV